MSRRGARSLLAAGALSLSALSAGCQVPIWPAQQPAACESCESCELPCCWWRGFGYSRRLDDHMARCAARYDALRALEAVPECLSANADYRDGFIDAYQDVATGHPGKLPAIPPEPYWHGCFRTGPAAQLAQDWFAGYADGAEQARQCYGVNEVPVSAPGYPPRMLGPQQGAHYGHSASGAMNAAPSNWNHSTGCPTCQGGRP